MKAGFFLFFPFFLIAPLVADAGATTIDGALSPMGAGVEEVVGLVLIIGFPDDPAVAGDQSFLPKVDRAPYPATSESYMDRMFNEVGFNTRDNVGSVRDYYLHQSGGKIDLRHAIAPEVIVDQPWSHYESRIRAIGLGDAGRELIRDAILKLNGTGWEVPAEVTRDSSGELRVLTVAYAGNGSMITPFSSVFGPTLPVIGATQGLKVRNFSISDYFARAGAGRELAGSGHGVFTHEIGHALFGWPDLYDYGKDDNYYSRGLGEFCLMAYGSLIARSKIPAPVNPYLKIREGWLTPVELSVSDLRTVDLPSSGNVVYRINSANPREYFLVENLGPSGNIWASGLPDAGIAIWHVDESVGNDWNERQNRTEALHYYISLEQADGRFDLETTQSSFASDAEDLFDLSNGVFSAETTPSSAWWHPSSGPAPRVEVLSAPGAVMTVRFGPLIQDFPLHYSAAANGSLSGENSQIVSTGGSGTAVTAHPAAGYYFLEWSDGSRMNPRIDTNVSAELSATAFFALNNPPEFSGFLTSTDEEQGLTIPLASLLVQIVDPDGHGFSITRVDSRSLLRSRLVLDASGITFIPPIGVSGTDRFSFTAEDEFGASVEGLITVEINTLGTEARSTNPGSVDFDTSGDPVIHFFGIPGVSYQVQVSGDLTGWTTIGSASASAEGVVEYTHEDATGGSLFYRLVR